MKKGIVIDNKDEMETLIKTVEPKKNHTPGNVYFPAETFVIVTHKRIIHAENYWL